MYVCMYVSVSMYTICVHLYMYVVEAYSVIDLCIGAVLKALRMLT